MTVETVVDLSLRLFAEAKIHLPHQREAKITVARKAYDSSFQNKDIQPVAYGLDVVKFAVHII